ncbi:MAG: GtrA family protein [Eubacteriales bacterium]|nr:GtrA family protein [Eubacteriales bacterium]
MMKVIEGFVEEHREILSYLFWGVMTTIVSWGSYSLFTILLGKHSCSPLSFNMEMSSIVFFSNALSWICATLFAFITNKIWVFNSKSWRREVFMPEFLKFVSTRLVTGGGEIVLVPMLVVIGLDQTIYGIEGGLSKVLVSVFVVVLNYIFSKIFIFRKNN